MVVGEAANSGDLSSKIELRVAFREARLVTFVIAHMHDKTLVRLLAAADPKYRSRTYSWRGVWVARPWELVAQSYAGLSRPSSPFWGRASVARKAATRDWLHRDCAGLSTSARHI